MEIIFLRHGEPDYAPVNARHFIGHGRSLAPLTPSGIQQAIEASKDPVLSGCELIVSSPLTRALQTAAIIAGQTGLALTVEVDLREWEPDKTFQFRTSEESFALHRDFWNCQGVYPEGETRKWEQVTEIIDRVDPIVRNYYDAGYQKILIVSHGGVIRRFTGSGEISYCKPIKIEYNGSYDYYGWVD